MDPVLTEYLEDASEQQQAPSAGVRRTARGAARLAGSVVTYSPAPVLRQAEAASTAIAASRVLSSQTLGQTPALLQMSEPNFTLVTPQSLMAQNPVWEVATRAAVQKPVEDQGTPAFQERLQLLNARHCLSQYELKIGRESTRLEHAILIAKEMQRDPFFAQVSQQERFRLAERIASGFLSEERAREEVYPEKERMYDEALKMREGMKASPSFAHLDEKDRLSLAERITDGHMSEAEAREMSAWAKGILENSNPAYSHLDQNDRRRVVSLTLEGNYLDRNMLPDEARATARKIYNV